MAGKINFGRGDKTKFLAKSVEERKNYIFFDINTKELYMSDNTGNITAYGMTDAERKKLDGITASADSVSVSNATTSGDKIVDITINGIKTTLYAKSYESRVAALESKKVIVEGDSRLTDSRNAKDVSAWAKAASKPSYNLSTDKELTGKLPLSKVAEISTSNITGSWDAKKLSGVIPSSNLPSYVDDVIEAENFAKLPETGEAGKIYVTTDTNKTYRWGGSAYVEISASLALGETSSTAYAGSKGAKNATDIAALKSSKLDRASTRNITINGTGYTVNSTVGTATPDIYGPITAGTNGYFVMSDGSGAPIWKNPAEMTVGTANKVSWQGVLNKVNASTSVNGLMSKEDKAKLDNIAENANAYTLPKATSGALGGIKIGFNKSGKSYPVELNTAGQAYVTVNWSDTQYSLSDFDITATAAELNYCDGVTSNIQTQLNNKLKTITVDSISSRDALTSAQVNLGDIVKVTKGDAYNAMDNVETYDRYYIVKDTAKLDSNSGYEPITVAPVTQKINGLSFDSKHLFIDRTSQINVKGYDIASAAQLGIYTSIWDLGGSEWVAKEQGKVKTRFASTNYIKTVPSIAEAAIALDKQIKNNANAINNKVDKESGKSLVLNTQITKLTGLDSQATINERITSGDVSVLNSAKSLAENLANTAETNANTYCDESLTWEEFN